MNPELKIEADSKPVYGPATSDDTDFLWLALVVLGAAAAAHLLYRLVVWLMGKTTPVDHHQAVSGNAGGFTRRDDRPLSAREWEQMQGRTKRRSAAATGGVHAYNPHLGREHDLGIGSHLDPDPVSDAVGAVVEDLMDANEYRRREMQDATTHISMPALGAHAPDSRTLDVERADPPSHHHTPSYDHSHDSHSSHDSSSSSDCGGGDSGDGGD